MRRYYMCVFGPDSSGAYHKEIVPEERAECEQFCVCHQLKTTCLIGPDSKCNFATIEVDRDFADNCGEKCVCSNQENYMTLANERLS